MRNARTAAAKIFTPHPSSGRRPAARAWLLGTTGLLLAASGPAAFARDTLPTGGTVASGTATIATSGGSVAVNQSTDKAIINWQGFSVGPDNSVVFDQPNAGSATLNRVTGSTGSEIAGKIRSNGAVYLINPNGIAITRTGSVQTGGGFIASTLGMSDADFNAGKLAFTGTGGSAAVRNDGNIAAGQGAYVALLGGSVSNSGSISVPLGTVGLGSGEQISLDLNGDHFMQVAMPTRALTGDGALVDMAGTITAAGGRVTLSAASVKNAVRNIINLSGTISADSAVGRAGSILLLGGDGGTVAASGTLSARATGATGDGGSIETSGASVDFTGLKVDTSAAHGATGRWLVDPTDLTVDAAAAATINANLATTNVTLQTDGYGVTSGPGITSVGPGDIVIDSALTWASANMLTLSAYHDISINAAITASIGGLTLAANNSGYQPASILSATGNIAVGSFVLNSGNWVQNAGTLASFSATDFSFSPYGASFLRAKGGDGSSANPYLLTDVYGIQGMRGYTDNLTARNYALANDIDASVTAGWNAGAGFLPVGDNGTFTGNFDGRGHSITGLTINTTNSNVGLFAQDAGNISNLALVGGSVTTTGYTTGALVGRQAGGTISNVSSSTPVSGAGNIGGLVGIADGTIVNARASGAVNGTADNVGGLVGILGYYNTAVSISNSSATGDVTNSSTRASDVGGLVGSATGSIDGSFATGKVTGAAGVDSVGGLVGYACSQVNGCAGTSATITNSYATGDVSSGNGNVGGLIGQAYNVTISGSYARGTVSDTGANQYFGGLVGGTRGTNVFTNVYATGDVAGTNNAGGLVGNASGTTISQAYATGNVSATQNGGNSGFGGLVGSLASDSSITQSYATGSVTHAFESNAYGVSVGGLVGAANGSVTFSHATGAVSGTNDNVGGLIGTDDNQSGIADTNNYATGDVTGNTTPDAYFSGANIGGLIGAIGSNETITASYATGNVSAVSHTGGQNAGGLIGHVGNVVLSLTKSFASGNVTVTGAVSTIDGYGNQHNAVSNKVGGLIGALDAYAATVDQTYATGAVTSDGQQSESGGLIGNYYDHSNGQSIVKNSYASGAVSALGQYATNPVNDQAGDAGGGGYKQNTGGLIGRIGWGAVANSYAVGNVTGGDDIGGLIGYASNTATVASAYTTGFDNLQGGAHLTQAQMQDLAHYSNTYAGWDFATVWAPPSAGNYPQLYALTPVVHATAGSATTTYGTAPTSLGTFQGGPASYVFGPAGDTLTGFLAGSTTATVASNAGTYAVTPYVGGTFTSTGGVVYRVVADGSGTLTINPAVITVTPVSASLVGNTTKTYDGTTVATLTPGNFLLSGFKNGDGATATQTVGAYASANAGTGILVTTNLSPNNFLANDGTLLSNYTLPTSASGAIGTITPASLTLLYTANAASRSYGDANPTPSGGVTASGLVGTDSLSGVTGGTAAFTSTATTASNAGSYAVTGTGLTATSGNYTVTAEQATGNATALTVTPRALTLAAAPLTRTYGAANPATDTATAQAGTTLVNGDKIGSVAVTSAATAKSNVGSYDLLASNAIFSAGLASNYRIAYVDAPSALTISPAMLSVTYVAAPASSVYGNALPALGGSITVSGLVNGDSVASVTTGTAGFASTAGATSGVGAYAITGSGIVAGSANYTLTTSQAAGNATALLITPRPLTVTATDATSVYGATPPALTYAVAASTAGTGLVNGDVLTGALTSAATVMSGIGPYAITQGTLTNPNYSFTFNGATLTITPAALQILYTAYATSSIYGNAIPKLNGSVTALGLVNGDTLANVTTGLQTFSANATSASSVGSYAEVGSGLLAAGKNYTITFAQAPGNADALAITPRPLVIAADPQTRYILLNNPTLTYSVGGLGLVNGDKLTGQLSTTAGLLSAGGRYAIQLGTLKATPNYALTFAGSTLTVNPPPTRSLSAFLSWLRDVVTQFEQRERACGAGAAAAALRVQGSAALTGPGCAK